MYSDTVDVRLRTVLNKRGFNLSGRQPVTRDVDNIINTSADPVIAFVVTSGTVSSELQILLDFVRK